jgi:hypothetical protein
MSTLQEYLDSLAQTAGLAEEDKAALKKVLGNQKFSEELEKGVKRQSDYSRNMDELKAEKLKVDTQIGQWREWYKTAAETDAARETELQELRAKAGVTVTPTTTTTGGYTKKELEDLLARERGQLIAVTKDMGRIASRHAADFHEALDVDAVEKIALEKGLTVVKAYEEYVAPRVKEISDKAIEEKLKQAHDAGVQEGLSKRDVPDEGSKSYHPIFGQPKQAEATKGMTDAQRASNFAEAWTKEALAAKHQ